MHTSKCFVGLSLVLLSLLSTIHDAASVNAALIAQEDSTVHTSHSPTESTPTDKFTQAVELAENGKTEQAFLIAKEARQESTPDRFISVNYVNTLVTIADQEDESYDVKILNEAIQEINHLKATKAATGDRDPEVAYHTMVATGRLAETLMPRSKKVASSLMIEEGSIAKRLKDNPMYPKESLASLATPVYHQAIGYAIKGNPEDAFRCLDEAFDLGFVHFNEVLGNEHLARLTDQNRLKKVTQVAEESYINKAEAWGRQALGDFKPFPFKLDVVGLDEARLESRDFPGEVLVVDLWATWCPPCREALPHFVELAEEFNGEGIQVIGVSMDNPEAPSTTRDAVSAVQKEQKLNFPIGLGDNSVTDQLPGKQLLPTTVFVDRAGNVRYIATGVQDVYRLSAIAKMLADESEAISVQTVD
jgi:thiol-disulfide isomerase/thioredoxin